MPRQTDPWDDWETEDYSRSSASGPSKSKDAADPAATASALSANAKLWQVANSSLSFAPSTTASSAASTPASAYSYQSSSSSIHVPPPQAFMPSLKILKRPSAPTSGASSAASSTNGDAANKNAKQTLQDRERAYKEARSRIFGPLEQDTPSSSLPSPKSAASSVPASTENSENEEPGGDNSSSTSARRKKVGAVVPSSSSTSTTQRRKRNDPAKGNTANGPISTILREPINPPTAGSKGKVVKGFTKTKRSKTPATPLSPAAQEFTPSFLTRKVPSSSSSSTTPPPKTLEVGMQSLQV